MNEVKKNDVVKTADVEQKVETSILQFVQDKNKQAKQILIATDMVSNACKERGLLPEETQGLIGGILTVIANQYLTADKKSSDEQKKQKIMRAYSNTYQIGCVVSKFIRSGIRPENTEHYYLYSGFNDILEFKLSRHGYIAKLHEDKDAVFCGCGVIREGDEGKICANEKGKYLELQQKLFNTGSIQASYAMIEYRGVRHLEIADKAKLDFAKDKAKKWDKTSSKYCTSETWIKFEADMCEKVALRSLMKKLQIKGVDRLNAVDNEDYDFNNSQPQGETAKDRFASLTKPVQEVELAEESEEGRGQIVPTLEEKEQISQENCGVETVVNEGDNELFGE